MMLVPGQTGDVAGTADQGWDRNKGPGWNPEQRTGGETGQDRDGTWTENRGTAPGQRGPMHRGPEVGQEGVVIGTERAGGETGTERTGEWDRDRENRGVGPGKR